MSTATIPLVSVGLPVYNGDKYLAIAIESILAQTFQDFELIISDNASTDGTREICESFVKRDSRVRYTRHPINRGAGFNYNFVFNQARGEYFKWLAHDDFVAPGYLTACLELLNAEPSIVLAYTYYIDVDERGASIRTESRTKGQGVEPSMRFWDLMEGSHTCEEVFGLIRTSVLRLTWLIQDYTDSDRTLLAELSLYGKFGEVPRPLFYHRVHPGSSVKMHPKFRGRSVWFNPALKGRLVLPAWKQFFHMLAAISRAPIGIVCQSACYWQAIRWFKWRWRWMFQELFSEVWEVSTSRSR
jgi:glycosyltransferase involved in cell wall biosynthesis